MTKEAKAAYWREYRKTHRDRYNVKQRERRANETPEHRERRLATRRAAYENMSDDQKACEYARLTESRNRRREAIRAYKREYWLKNRERLIEYSKAWKERNYQRHLQYNRDRRMLLALESGRDFKPRMSMRIPSYATCPAHARWLAKVSYERRAAATVSVSCAIQSGLTIGRFSA